MDNSENKNEMIEETAVQEATEIQSKPLTEEENIVIETETESEMTEPVEKMPKAVRAGLITLVLLALAAFLILLSFSLANTGNSSYSELKNALLG